MLWPSVSKRSRPTFFVLAKGFDSALVPLAGGDFALKLPIPGLVLVFIQPVAYFPKFCA
jgi:hypothetical protein